MERILMVRLGAMGDIVHTLPASAALRAKGRVHLTWLVERKWAALLERNPHLDAVTTLDRTSATTIWESIRRLRRQRFDLAVDFQGLLKSAAGAWLSGAPRRVGFAQELLREKPAAWLYTERATPRGAHVVDLNRALAEAAGAPHVPPSFALPAGSPEGELPREPFVLACPLAGWAAKEWPDARWCELARLLRERGWTLVLNGPPGAAQRLRAIDGASVHVSGLAGLLDATRRAAGVVGLDSGPLHIAAALAKPGVALFGPTSPQRNGPYGGTIGVLRAPEAATTYKRSREIAPSMWQIRANDVLIALMERLQGNKA